MKKIKEFSEKENAVLLLTGLEEKKHLPEKAIWFCHFATVSILFRQKCGTPVRVLCR